MSDDSGDGVWVTLTELAALKEVTKQTIAGRLERYERDGLVTTRKKGRSRLINLAEYDAAAEEQTDPAKLLGAATAKRAAAADVADDPAQEPELDRDHTYSVQQARRARYDADLREIELRKLRGELVAVDDVRVALEQVTETLAGEIDRLPTFADDLVAAVGAGGASAVRDLLKVKARELRENMADAMLGAIADHSAEELAA